MFGIPFSHYDYCCEKANESKTSISMRTDRNLVKVMWNSNDVPSDCVYKMEYELIEWNHGESKMEKYLDEHGKEGR